MLIMTNHMICIISNLRRTIKSFIMIM